MADNTPIEWTDATWNPITGCSVVSPGCTNCYAMKLAGTRLKHTPSRVGLTIDSKAGPVWNGQVRLNADQLTQPLRWRRPRRIFVCAHGDLFHESVPDVWIDQVFAVMALSPQHTFQILTKRAARMRAYASDPATPGRIARVIVDMLLDKAIGSAMDWPVRSVGDIDNPDDITVDWPLPNVWLGVSAEDQVRADERIPHLLATPAAIRFLSAEPLLGAIDLTAITWRLNGLTGERVKTINALTGAVTSLDPIFTVHEKDAPVRLDWVIAGGESGPAARPMHPDWARQVRNACAADAVPFFFKQWGAHAVVYDRDDDPDWTCVGKIADQTPKGRWLNLAGGHGFHGERVVRVVPASKKAAGRLLDGVEHNAMPGGDHAPA